MYNPFDRAAYRAQRRYNREMRRYYRYQNPMRGLAGLFIVLALIFAFGFHGNWEGSSFLGLLFIGLAIASLLGSASTFHRYGMYGGFNGFIWLLTLAFCFMTGLWELIWLPIAISCLMGIFYRPIMSGLGAAPWFAAYAPPQQQTYQQGNAGAPQQLHETYQEGGQQFEAPQAPAPQQQDLPPVE